MRIKRRKYRTLAFAYKTAGLLWGLVHVCAVVGFLTDWTQPLLYAGIGLFSLLTVNACIGGCWRAEARADRLTRQIAETDKNGCEPYGNNNYGKDARETTYKARKTSDDSGKTGRVATGTGPVTWSHDGTLAGIWDMNGNVWEWVTGLRLVYGEIQIIADNDAADNSCDLSASSTAWKAIRASDGALVTPDGNGTTDGTVKMDWINNKCVYSTTITTKADTGRGCSFKDVTCDSTIGAAAKLLLQALAMLPDTALTGEGIDANYGGDYFYFNNGTAERCPCRGASWYSGGYAGVFNVSLNNPRSSSSTNVGGRSAFRQQHTVQTCT